MTPLESRGAGLPAAGGCRDAGGSYGRRAAHVLLLAVSAWRFAVPAATIFLAGCAATVESPPVRAEQRPWPEGGSEGVELLSDHFAIRMTARDPVLREALPAFMETALVEYTRLIPAPAVQVGRLPVYLFETREEWARFTRRFAPAQADTYLHIQAGGYTDFATGAAVAFDIARDRTLSLLAHEGFHQYAARYLPRPLPAWLNEGLACQFEAFELKGGRPVFTPARNLLRKASLREALIIERGLIPFDTLLEMHAGMAVRRTGQPTQAFYAQLWSAIVYLRDPSCPYAAGFRRMLSDAGSGRLDEAARSFQAAHANDPSRGAAEAAFRHYITSDLDAFTAGYRAFAERLVR